MPLTGAPPPSMAAADVGQRSELAAGGGVGGGGAGGCMGEKGHAELEGGVPNGLRSGGGWWGVGGIGEGIGTMCGGGVAACGAGGLVKMERREGERSGSERREWQ